MNKIKLGYKIALGFGALVALAAALGLLALWNMNLVKGEATRLQKENVPEVAVSNNVERSVLLAMYEVRAYGLAEDDAALKRGLAHLTEAKTFLAEAKRLGGSAPSLQDLKVAAERAEARVVEYEKLIQETISEDRQIEKDRQSMDVAAREFSKICDDYITKKTVVQADEIKSGKPAEKLLERAQKLTLANTVSDAVSAIRLLAWRAQAERNIARLNDAKAHFDTIKTSLDAMRPITSQKEDLEQIDACQKAANDYRTALQGLAEDWGQKDALAGKRSEVATAALLEARNTATLGLADTAKVSEQATASLGRAGTVLTWGLIAAAALGAVTAFFITRSITLPIMRVANTLSSGADQTAAAAGQVSSASQTLAAGASQQAASLEETSSALAEMSSMTKRNAENAQKANDLAREANETAAAGATDMQAMASAMNDIKLSSDGIAKIIKTIDEIAFQTNILALNAAVEAARAGEAGMGFAVVADEVRSLAQRSAVAAKETAEKIEGAISKTALGVSLTEKVAHTLQEIVTKAGQVDRLAAEVASASKEQTQGIVQLNSAITEIDKVTQSNAANAEESASAAEELNAQTEALKESVSELLGMVKGSGRVSAGPAPAKADTPLRAPHSHGIVHHNLTHAPKTNKAPARMPTKSTPPPAPSAKAANADSEFFADSTH